MAKRRDYAAEYRSRRERARERGFQSYWQQRRSPRRLVRAEDFSLLPDRARDSRSDAFRVVRVARREQATIEETAGRLGVPVSSVRFWAPEALRPTRGGKTLPTRGDRLTQLRPLLLQGEGEITLVAVRGSRAVARADAIFDIQWRYAHGQADESQLEQLRGARVSGRRVESDPERLEYAARGYGFDVAEAYRELIG